MANVEKLQEEELMQLTEEQETSSLENLITEGAELQIPITFDFPTKKGIRKASAIIKPVTTVEWENAQQYALKNKKEFMVRILSKGLLNDDGEPLSVQLIKMLPFGVANEIYMRIADISGLKQTRKEQFELTRELLGF